MQNLSEDNKILDLTPVPRFAVDWGSRLHDLSSDIGINDFFK